MIMTQRNATRCGWKICRVFGCKGLEAEACVGKVRFSLKGKVAHADLLFHSYTRT